MAALSAAAARATALELCCAELAAGTGVRRQVGGRSMRPLLRDGDVVTLQPVSAHTLRLGDVVLCLGRDGRPLLHRLVGTRRTPQGLMLRTKGDALRAEDTPVAADALLGRLERIERADGAGARRIDASAWRWRLSGLAVVARYRARRLAWRLYRALGRPLSSWRHGR